MQVAKIIQCLRNCNIGLYILQTVKTTYNVTLVPLVATDKLLGKILSKMTSIQPCIDTHTHMHIHSSPTPLQLKYQPHLPPHNTPPPLHTSHTTQTYFTQPSPTTLTKPYPILPHIPSKCTESPVQKCQIYYVLSLHQSDLDMPRVLN